MKVQAPGRICLFGEHQDYLGYPVIAAAINRYIFIAAEPLKNPPQVNEFRIKTPDIPSSRICKIPFPTEKQLLAYESKRDYLRSGMNVAYKSQVRWPQGWNVTITGNIPINAGASSSSAMVIAWLTFLFAAGRQPLSPHTRGELGYQTEVAEFKEAGGMMDHFASSFGNLLFVESKPVFKATPLLRKLNGFVLGNSKVKKNTVDDLKRVKALALAGFDHLKETMPTFDRFTTPFQAVQPFLPSLKPAEQKIVEGNLINRDLTQEARIILADNNKELDEQRFGQMLSKHHEMLSQNVGVSHPINDEMVKMVLKAGALGAKINGSGFGGTMFAYAPKTQANVVKALTDAGFESWAIEICDGASITMN